MQDGSDEQVSIIVVHKDTPEYLNICLQSIAVTSVNNNYEVIVVDNGSGDETQAYLDSIEQVYNRNQFLQKVYHDDRFL
jgi:glycosyltransferase involved in cell wall biosynthesis